MIRRNWTEEELFRVLELYCDLPFGKMHSKNPDIIALAEKVGRTPSAVAMKMVNFASLDPTVSAKGMSNTSKLDQEVWGKFFNNIDDYLTVFSTKYRGLDEGDQTAFVSDERYGVGDTLAMTKVRQGHQKFRKMVLASYENRCAVSGLNDPRLLVASHIAPWAALENRRLDPRNGICLNALWDRAFDRGLISLTDSLDLVFSSTITHATRTNLESLGHRFQPPPKFGPDVELLAAHRKRFGYKV